MNLNSVKDFFLNKKPFLASLVAYERPFLDVTTIVLIIVIPLICALFIVALLLWIKYFSPVRIYLKKHDNNVRRFTYNANTKKVYYFDSRNLNNPNEVSFDTFLKQFHSKTLGERKIENWLNNMLTENKPSFVIRTQIHMTKHKGTREVFLKVNKVDKEHQIVHFESFVLSNSYLAKSNLKNLPFSNIMNYDTYISKFRVKMFRNKPCQFYFVGFKIDNRYAYYEKEFSKDDATIKLLGEYLAKNLKKGSYLVYIDNLSLMIIDTKPETQEAIANKLAMLHKDTDIFLSLNNLDDHYVPVLGVAVHEKETPILPLEEYKKLSEKDAFSKLNTLNALMISKGYNIQTIIDHSMFRFYFTPIFNLKTGEASYYIFQIKPYMAGNKEINMGHFLEETDREKLLPSFLDQVLKRAVPRVNSSPSKAPIIFPISLLISEDFLAYFDKLPDTALRSRLRVMLFESEIKLYSGLGLENILKELSKRGLGPILSMDNTPSSLPDTIINEFESIIIKKENKRLSLVKDLPSRAYTLSTLKSLAPYKKQLMFEGLNGVGECYFAKIHGVYYGSSQTLCPPSSYLENLDINGQSIIDSINNKPSMTRI